MSKLYSGGCSFTFGSELQDDFTGQPSEHSWAALLASNNNLEHVCTAHPGHGNSAIARRVYENIEFATPDDVVTVMWTFYSRYDWAFEKHRTLENFRWASITPWDTDDFANEAVNTIKDFPEQLKVFKTRIKNNKEAGVHDFANALYRYGSNQYHELYLSWKSILWLQNVLEQRKIPYMFTLAENTLFYHNYDLLFQDDNLMRQLYNDINFDRWFAFGERHMGFYQWALLEDYPIGSTHPLDQAHIDASKLMQTKFEEARQ